MNDNLIYLRNEHCSSVWVLKMGWSKPSESLLDFLEETRVGVEFERRKMFGQWALFLRGHMFTGVFQDDIFVRIRPEEQDMVRELSDEIEQFEPLKGRAMKEYLVLPPAIVEDKQTLISVLNRSIDFVSTFPPK